MKNNFKVEALDYSIFEHLFEMSNSELSNTGAKRIIVDKKPGYPCRVSLQDAEIGEEVILVAHTHHDVTSPYRSSGPVYVRKSAIKSKLENEKLPTMLYHRKLSIRAYDKNAMMLDAKTANGNVLENTVDTILNDSKVSYLHIHNSGPGCYNCLVVRSQEM